jgi:hypothetical protein
LMIACMLGCTQDALNWDTSLASDLMTLSMTDLLKDINSDVLSALIGFFKQGFWNTASPQKKQEWLQMMQYIHPYISSYFDGDEFMPEEELPSSSLPTIQENITPAISYLPWRPKQFSVHVKAIVGSKQAKMNGFVDFVPHVQPNNQLQISSNRSRLHYAIIDNGDPSVSPIYEPDDATRHEVKDSKVLIAHHCPQSLMKLLLNYASYEQRGILAFVLLDEHFLAYYIR